MDIILLKNLDKVGDKHEVVTVKNGFGRNFLIPKGLAVIANKANLGKLDELKEKEAASELARLEEYQELSAQVHDKTIKIGVKSGTSGKIFGSVTNVQVAAALKEQFGFEIERRKISLPDEISTIGTYQATLNLHPEVKTTINIDLVAE